jgi:hypothetical protein
MFGPFMILSVLGWMKSILAIIMIKINSCDKPRFRTKTPSYKIFFTVYINSIYLTSILNKAIVDCKIAF